MYKTFFGLKRNPFEISPDPYFLFPTDRYNEALASIYYGIRRHKGFVVLTGEVGTGKTLMVRCLMELLTRQNISFANVFNPLLSGIEFLRYVSDDLALKPVDYSKTSLLRTLNEFLIARYRKGLTTVLIVDEAQHLLPEVLEEIRLLTNLETSEQKLLQILLVGQPELEPRLDSAQLRQLKQRIALRCRLEPLEEQETRNYIIQRMRRAGMTDGAESVFPAETINAVYKYSRGIPRLINTLCENSFVIAFARHERSVTQEMVKEVSAEFRLECDSDKATYTTSKQDQSAAASTLLEILESLQRYRSPASTNVSP